MIRRGWVIVLAGLILGIAAGCAAAVIRTPTYQASSTAFVSTSSASTLTDLNQGTTFTQQVVTSYATVATSPYVLDRVISQLGLKVTSTELATRVSASVPADTVTIVITANDPSPTTAARIANATVHVLASAVLALTPDTSGNTAAVRITQIAPAAAPLTAADPQIVRYVGLAGFAGLALAILVVYMRERLSSKVRDVDEIAYATNLPVLGQLYYDETSVNVRAVTVTESGSVNSEAVRALRTNLHFVNVSPSTSLVVTSALPSEGKSTVVANLAAALAESGEAVIVVDADLRRPTLDQYYGIDSSVGLTNVLIGEVDLNDAIQTWGPRELAVLPAGTVPPNPSELLQSTAMIDLMRELEATYSTILFDAPPLLPVTDAAVLGTRVSGVVLVAALNRVRPSELRHALDALEQVQVKILGLVVSMIPRRSRRHSYYNYGYEPGTTSAATPQD